MRSSVLCYRTVRWLTSLDGRHQAIMLVNRKTLWSSRSVCSVGSRRQSLYWQYSEQAENSRKGSNVFGAYFHALAFFVLRICTTCGLVASRWIEAPSHRSAVCGLSVTAVVPLCVPRHIPRQRRSCCSDASPRLSDHGYFPHQTANVDDVLTRSEVRWKESRVNDETKEVLCVVQHLTNNSSTRVPSGTFQTRRSRTKANIVKCLERRSQKRRIQNFLQQQEMRC